MILKVFAAITFAATITFSQTPPIRVSFTVPAADKYASQTDGITLEEIVGKAIGNNGDVRIAQLGVERARARLMQARLRANPSIEVEHSSGSIVGAPGDRETSVGLNVPLDIYGQRKRRIDLANAEIALREAELIAVKRGLVRQVLVTYSEALTALNEVQVLDRLLELDTRTVAFVQIRVNEGDTAPLELNLLQTEVERLRARRDLAEGKLQASLSSLKFFAGVPHEQPLRLRDEIATAGIPKLPANTEVGLSFALTARPELRVAQLEEQLAAAGLRLVRSQAKPDLTAFSRYAQGKATFDDPMGPFRQSDRSLTFGVSIGLPIFDKKQGEKAEALIAIRQAQEKRSFAEAIIRNEVVGAFQRVTAADRAVNRLQWSVLPRSEQNIETIRKVYEVGELRITDLIAEQRRLLDANRDLTEALAERYRARADLFFAVGLEF